MFVEAPRYQKYFGMRYEQHILKLFPKLKLNRYRNKNLYKLWHYTI